MIPHSTLYAFTQAACGGTGIRWFHFTACRCTVMHLQCSRRRLVVADYTVLAGRQEIRDVPFDSVLSGVHWHVVGLADDIVEKQV